MFGFIHAYVTRKCVMSKGVHAAIKNMKQIIFYYGFTATK